jgi:hypothetical protein
MSIYDDDLSSMFTDLPSVTVVFGEASGLAFKNIATDDVLMGMERGVVGEVLTLEFPTARFPGLQIGSALTVDGVPYTVRDRRKAPAHVDGAITEADLVLTSAVTP